MPTSSVGADKSSDALARLRIQRASGERRTWTRWLSRALLALIALAMVLLALVFLAGRLGWVSEGGMLSMTESLQPRPEVRLAVMSVEKGRSADATVVATGYLESRWQAQIGARAPGRIQNIDVEEGTRVKTDQILAVLEHADLDASLAGAEANRKRAIAALKEQDVMIKQRKREFERAEIVWKSKSVAESDYDIAKFAYEGAVARRDSLAADVLLAEARVREAEQMKANMFILAPFDGTVISKDAEVGESILPGGMGEASGRGSVVTVADLDHLEVDCDVKEDFISRVKHGQLAEVAVDAIPDYRYPARVRKIIPMGDRARSTIKVKVEILNVDGRLFPEMSATVYFLPADAPDVAESTEPRVFCETKAIQGSDPNHFVWTVDDDDRARQVEVTIGPERDNRSEVTRGLTGGERVIIAPPDLKPGQLVKIVP